MRLITDTQVPQRFVIAVRSLESLLHWTVETVYEAAFEEEGNDARLVRFAHQSGGVLVTFDQFERDQGPVVAEEIRDRGGRFICISGGPQQGWQRAPSKLLYRCKDIEAWFDSNQGGVAIRKHDDIAYFARESENLLRMAARSMG